LMDPLLPLLVMVPPVLAVFVFGMRDQNKDARWGVGMALLLLSATFLSAAFVLFGASLT
jgi:hypothetical protein